MTPTDRGLSRAQVYKQLDASLARLRVDYVDLYQCHRYDGDTPVELAFPGIEKFVSSQPQYSLCIGIPSVRCCRCARQTASRR